MNEIYFEHNLDDIIKQLKKREYSSKKDLLFITSLGILSFYSVMALQGYRGKVFDSNTYNKIAVSTALGCGILGNLFINIKRKSETYKSAEALELMKEFTTKLEEIDIFSSEVKVVESVKERTKYKDLYYLFDNAGDINIFSKTELSKRKKGQQITHYNKESITITDTNLEVINTGVKEEFSATDEELRLLYEKCKNKDFDSINEEDYLKQYPYYIYNLDYNLDGNTNKVKFYLDKNRVKIVGTEGSISDMKDPMKYIYLKLALQETKEKDNMRVYVDPFKAKIIKR